MFGVELNVMGSMVEELIKRIMPLLMEIMHIYKEDTSMITVSPAQCPP